MIARSLRPWAAALALALALAPALGCPGALHQPRPAPVAEVAPATAPPVRRAPAVILAMNDTYRAEGDTFAQAGGFPRVRALRLQLEREHPSLLVTHAGDLLQPSFMSRLYGGDQMIDLLNQLDGDAAASDPRLFVTFGNHEFDKSALEDGPALDRRVEQSQFTWLSANVQFAAGADGQPIVAAPNLLPRRLVESGGYRVGLFGLTTDRAKAAFVTGFGDRVELARQQSAALRAEGADFVVAITHLDMNEDKALLAALGASGPDLIVGGHEHNQQDARVGRAAVVKANADATSVAVVKLERVDGAVSIRWDFVPLTGAAPAPDPALDAAVAVWQARHDREFCAKVGSAPGCLAQPVGGTAVPLIAEELEIRRFETNLGDQIADWMLEATAAQKTQVAFINSGSLRLNRNIAAGPLTRQVVEELFAYPSPLTVVELDGATLLKVAQRAVTDWTGQGHYLQIAGFAFRFDPTTGAVSGLSLREGGRYRAVRPDEKIRAVTLDFLLDPKKGQDGYTMLVPSMVRKGPSVDLKDGFFQRLAAAGGAGISPTVEGRVCNAGRPGPCLAVSP